MWVRSRLKALGLSGLEARPARSSRRWLRGVAAGVLVLGFAAFALLPWTGTTPLAVTAIALWLGFFGFGWYGPWVAYVSDTAPPDQTGFTLGAVMASRFKFPFQRPAQSAHDSRD